MDNLPGFEPIAPVPAEVIERYRGQVVPELIDIWTNQGYGTALDGFLKIIDPDEYAQRLSESLPRPDLVPIMATGMADIVVWDPAERNACVLQYRSDVVTVLGSSIRHLPMRLNNPEYLSRKFDWQPYCEATANYGPVAYDEAFGYVPLLALGGPRRVENLQNVKLIEHVNLIAHLAGKIQYS